MRPVAVGECGLDYHYDHSPRDAQRDAFAAQIALAHELGLPLVIHTREAWDDTFDILDAEGVPAAHDLPLLHRRPGRGPPLPRPRRVPQLLRHRHVQRRAGGPRGRGDSRPLDRMLVETDSPYLAPVPAPRQAEPAGVGAVRRAPVWPTCTASTSTSCRTRRGRNAERAFGLV